MLKPVTSIQDWLKRQEHSGHRVETLAPEVSQISDTFPKIAEVIRTKKKELKTKRPCWLLIVEPHGGLLVTRETDKKGTKYTAYHFVHLNTSFSQTARSILIRTLMMLGVSRKPGRVKHILSRHIGAKGMLITRLDQEEPRFTPLNQED